MAKRTNTSSLPPVLQAAEGLLSSPADQLPESALQLVSAIDNTLERPPRTAGANDASLLSKAFARMFTVEDERVIIAVVQFFERAAAWLLCSTGPTDAAAALPQLDTQLRHLVQHRAWAPVVCQLLLSFTRVTGIGPTSAHSCDRFICLLAFLAVATEPDSEKLWVDAAGGVLQAIAQGPARALLESEQQASDTNEGRIKQEDGSAPVHLDVSLPMLFSAPSASPSTADQVRQDTKDKEASDSDSDCIDLDSPSPRTTTHPPTAPTTNAPHPHPAERLPYALQCYQLVIWLLQRPCLDALEWKEGTHGRLCHAVLSETFVCLGGSAQQYSACVLSTLSAALQMLAATRPKVAGGPLDTVLSPTAYTELKEWVWQCAGERVLDTLRHTDLPALMPALLNVSGAVSNKDIAACVLELLKVMLGSDLPALLTVLVEWLRPETNCSADVRLAAINALVARVSGHVKALGDTPKDSLSALWTPYVSDVLLFSVMHDPSAKVRRVGIRLMHFMSVGQEATPLGTRIAAAVLAKTRETDAQARDAAVKVVVRLSAARVLQSLVTPADQCWLLHVLLTELNNKAGEHKRVTELLRVVLAHTSAGLLSPHAALAALASTTDEGLIKRGTRVLSEPFTSITEEHPE